MRKLFTHGSCLLLACVLMVSPLCTARAADYFSGNMKPVMAFSVSSVEEVLSDVDWLTKAAGAEDQGEMIQMMAPMFTAGISPEGPIGMVVGTDGIDFKMLGFVPTSDLEAVFDLLEQQFRQRPEEVEDGVYEFEGPNNTLYIKEDNGYAFFAKEVESLSDLPSDPAELLGDLPEQYTVAAEVFVQNIPENFREIAIQQMRGGMESSLHRQPDETEEAFALRRTMVRQQIQQFADLIEQSEDLTIGLAIDSEEGRTYFDISLTAQEGTKTARQFEALSGLTSDHAGFLLPNAAVTVNFTSHVVSEDIEQALLMLENAENNAMLELENSDNLPDNEARELAQDLLSGLFDALAETLQEGTIDGGAALVLEPNSMTMVAGGHVASGADLEEQFDKMVELSSQDHEFPGVERDVFEHSGVRFHSIVVPLDDEPDAQKVFGEEIEILVGFGEQSFYVVFGNDCSAVVRAVLDGSANSVGADLPPMQLNIALAPILRFAASLEGNPAVELAAQTLEDRGGDDRITLRVVAIERGVNYRLEVEEGVLEAIGVAVQSAVEGAGGGVGAPAF